MDRSRFGRTIELYEGLWAQAIEINHPEARMEWIGGGFEDLSPFHVFDIRELGVEDLQWAVAMMSRLHHRTPLNGDHHLLWSWCLVTCASSQRMFGKDWTLAFRKAALLIGADSPQLGVYSAVEPLLYALLEGGLRRLLPAWVSADGIARKDIRTSFGKLKSGKRLNRIGVLLELFKIAGDSGTRDHFAAVLQSMSGRFEPRRAIEHEIDQWRCELLHGEDYSRERAPYLMDLLTLLLLSGVDGPTFEAERAAQAKLPVMEVRMGEQPATIRDPGSGFVFPFLEDPIRRARAELLERQLTTE